MRLTRHNGRAGKNGVYNPKHNDRNFNISGSEHIDEIKAIKNVYYTWIDGLYSPELLDEGEEKSRFVKCEQMAYIDRYSDYVMAQNERNEKTRHTERNKTVYDLLANKKTCPEETIYQIGDMDVSVPPEVLMAIAVEFFEVLEEKYGEYYHTLDWALHLDEATPHIHERHVFDCKNQYGEICPQQEKALEAMGIPLPEPNKKPGRNNNRKMSFDSICRELFLDICEKYKLEIERDPIYGGRKYQEKMDYIIQKQKEKITSLEEKVISKENELADIEGFLEEVTEASYNKACEVAVKNVAIQASEETKRQALDKVNKYRNWYMSSDNWKTIFEKNIANKIFSKMEEKIMSIGDGIINAVSKALNNFEIKEKAKEEIKEEIRPSLLNRLAEKKAIVDGEKQSKLENQQLDIGNSRNKRDNRSI